MLLWCFKVNIHQGWGINGSCYSSYTFIFLIYHHLQKKTFCGEYSFYVAPESPRGADRTQQSRYIVTLAFWILHESPTRTYLRYFSCRRVDIKYQYRNCDICLLDLKWFPSHRISSKLCCYDARGCYKSSGTHIFSCQVKNWTAGDDISLGIHLRFKSFCLKIVPIPPFLIQALLLWCQWMSQEFRNRHFLLPGPKIGPEGWYLVDAALTQEHRVAVSSQKSRRYGSFYDIILSQIW